MLLGVLELPMYAVRRGRYANTARAAASMALGGVVTLLLWRRCWVATLYTLVLPYFITSLAATLGNWVSLHPCMCVQLCVLCGGTAVTNSCVLWCGRCTHRAAHARWLLPFTKHPKV